MATKAATAKLGLSDMYDELERVLLKFAQHFTVRSGRVQDKRDCHLVSVRDVVISERKYSEVSFASVIQQKDYIGFYYMPVYTVPELREQLPSPLLRMLKGKACFHVKELTGDIRSAIEEALALGVAAYRQNDWLEQQ
jgi:hypothetical protein